MKKLSLVIVLIAASFTTNGIVVHADDHKHEDKKNMRSIKTMTMMMTIMSTNTSTMMMKMKVKLIIFKMQ